MRKIPHTSLLYTLTCLMLLWVTDVSAQKTIVTGSVIDAETKEALPFVNISFKNSKIGTTSNLQGQFSLSTYYATDSIVASFVGYRRQSKKVAKDRTQTVVFELRQSATNLDEIVVEAKDEENPAHPIIRSAIAHRKINNREKLDAYEYETYNKIEFDVNNIKGKVKDRSVMKPFEFIFDYVDTTGEKSYLPLLITEAVSRYYYRKKPKSDKEVIMGTKVSGTKNKSISQFLGDMHQNVNIYDNYMGIFGRNFLSPVSDFAFFSYRFYLLDSAYIGKNWCYKIQFQPKRKYELTFKGTMWIHDTTYAIKSVEAEMSGDANINFINSFRVAQEYDQVEKEVWMLRKDKLVVDFSLAEKGVGVYGRKTTSYKDFKINQPREDDFYTGANNLILSEDVNEKSDAFWDTARHERLSKQEQQIYEMIDSIQHVPIYRTYRDIIILLVTGYYVRGKFEWGPYSSTYSFNPIEGHRFRVGGRTSNEFSKRIMLNGYLAYGLRDQRFKYSLGFWYFLSKSPRQSIGGSYHHDIEQLGLSNNAWTQDNIVTSILRRNPANRLNGYDQYRLFFEREWFPGFSNRLSGTHRQIQPLGDLVFEQALSDGGVRSVNNLITSEVSLSTRFAYKERFLSGEFERTSLGTKFPIVQVELSAGVRDLLGGDYNYQKAMINVQDKVDLKAIGDLQLIANAGKIWGTLPYPLLELHNGNETYGYDDYAFNLMNFFEFVSDEYASLSATHHFQGLFFNKIPLFRRLKWREVVSAKGVVGRLGEHHQNELLLGPNMNELDQPYFEGGVGIENIFKLIRVDALWRLSHRDHPGIAKFGIRTKFAFKF